MSARAAFALLLALAAPAAAGPLWDDLGAPEHGPPRALVDEGRALLGRRDFTAASARLAEAARLAPDQPESYLLLGAARRGAGDDHGARLALERARALLPDGGGATLAYDLGTARAVDGDLEGSLRELRRAEAEGGLPGDGDLVAFALGDTLMALGRLAEAIPCYRRALGRGPGRPAVHFALAAALDRDEQLEESRAELDLALARDRELRALRAPEEGGEFRFVPPADRLYLRALAERARGRLAAARACLRAFLAAPPGPYAARARDREAALEGGVDRRELGGAGYDRVAMAAALSSARADAERCLAPHPGELLGVVLSVREARAPGLSPVERECLGAATARARKLIDIGTVLWPLARPADAPTR